MNSNFNSSLIKNNIFYNNSAVLGGGLYFTIINNSEVLNNIFKNNFALN
jgi:hypothetical protein